MTLHDSYNTSKVLDEIRLMKQYPANRYEQHNPLIIYLTVTICILVTIILTTIAIALARLKCATTTNSVETALTNNRQAKSEIVDHNRDENHLYPQLNNANIIPHPDNN